MGFDQTMGALYPFTLKDKLQRVTEACDRWTLEGALRSPWGRPVLPLEMVSVLLNYTNREDPFPIRGAPVGLFAGIREFGCWRGRYLSVRNTRWNARSWR